MCFLFLKNINFFLTLKEQKPCQTIYTAADFFVEMYFTFSARDIYSFVNASFMCILNLCSEDIALLIFLRNMNCLMIYGTF